jgi:ankyrin repeat protein
MHGKSLQDDKQTMALPPATRNFLIAPKLITVVLILLCTAACRPSPEDKLLIEAVKSGDIAKVNVLLAQGADVNTHAGRHLTTPLQEAVQLRNKEMVRLLLNEGADTGARMEYGASAMDFAVHHETTEILQLLLDYDAEINQGRNTHGTPLLSSVGGESEPSPEIVRFLLSNGADVNGGNKGGFKPLHAAIWNGHEETVQILLKHGADVTAICPWDWCAGTPLSMARTQGFPKIEALLLSHTQAAPASGE